VSSDDLRERLAAAIRSHNIDETRIDWWNEQDPYCVCGEQVKDWDEHAAKVALATLLGDSGELLDRMSDAIDKAIISGDDYNPVKAATAAISVLGGGE
jgi:hypothetical protein